MTDDQPASAAPAPCGAQYGGNPDHCNQPTEHRGPHSNRWGTTWAQGERR